MAAWLPIVGDDVHALRALAGASELAARAGRSLAEAAQETGWAGTTVPGLTSAGSIDTAALARAGPAVRSAATLLTRAEGALATVSTSRLFGPVRETVDTARRSWPPGPG